MVSISEEYRQQKLRFQIFPIGTNTYFHVWNFLWDIWHHYTQRFNLCFCANLATILHCLPILGKSGMLNFNFMSVFDMFHECQVFIINA